MNMRYLLSPPLYFRPKKVFYSVFSDIPPLLYHFPRHTSRFFSFPHYPKEKAAEKARRYFIKVYSLSFLRIICLLLLFS